MFYPGSWFFVFAVLLLFASGGITVHLLCRQMIFPSGFRQGRVLMQVKVEGGAELLLKTGHSFTVMSQPSPSQ